MNRVQLEISLEKIGWRIQKSPNGLNDWLVNSKGEITDLVFYGNELQIRSDSFGKSSHNGCFSFGISKIQILEGNNFCGTYKGKNLKDNTANVDYVTLKFNSKCFIQLYKRNKK